MTAIHVPPQGGERVRSTSPGQEAPVAWGERGILLKEYSASRRSFRPDPEYRVVLYYDGRKRCPFRVFEHTAGGGWSLNYQCGSLDKVIRHIVLSFPVKGFLP